MNHHYKRGITFLLLILTLIIPETIQAEPQDSYQERKSLFERMGSLMMIPWYYLAAIDRYENSIHKPFIHEKDRSISITISQSTWTGLLNPDYEDSNPISISFFSGIGRDGDGDGIASLNNDIDQLYSMAYLLSTFGNSDEDMRIALWEYYKNQRTVQVIDHIAKIIQKYQSLDLNKKAFPLPRGYNYSYQPTWGDARGWGGRRMHEGTDLFAGYGTPVRSTCYGYVEVMGWNNYGGWRLGIRDMNNVYYYYAHLSGFNKQVKVGSIVEPGQIIGYVGSSGYGKPGTSGKFTSHLHFGMYKYNGKTEWAFDPYPYLRLWELKRN